MVLNIYRRDRIYLPQQKIGDYSILKIIGEGRYGICYQVFEGQQFYVLKQLKRGMLKKVVGKVHFEEIILKELNHQSIPRFIKQVDQEGFYGYVIEYKEGRTFEDIICHDGYVFDRKEIYQVGKQIIDILKYLHSQGVVHRDIRIPNTLYDGEKVYLVDFGLARWINFEKYKADTDFAFLGDFLLFLYYSSFEVKSRKKRPWYEELELHEKELKFLKRLICEDRFKSIDEVENDFCELTETCV
jgi:serine/threonine-protein kinase